MDPNLPAVNPSDLLLAFDCGGSSSRSRIETVSGVLVHEGSSGPANWASSPRDLVREHMSQCLQGFSGHVAHATVCMAGILTEQNRLDCQALVTEIAKCDQVRAVPDYYASLAACDDDNAVCVISGTGSLVCSFEDSNQVVKSGGGGPLLGDWGSGFWAGKTALGRFLYAREHNAPPESLRTSVAKLFGSADINEVLSILYRRPSPAAELAKLGSDVAALADEGDEFAQSILVDAMQPLAELTIEHMRNHGFPQRRYKVYRAGGFWKASHFVTKFFEVQLHLPTFEPPLSPLEGAMKLTRRFANL